MKKDIYGDFYSPLRVMSYNRPYVFVTGSRSQGKSVGFGIYILLQAIKKKKQFIYIRRTDSELKETAPTFMKDPVFIINRYYGNIIKNWKYEKGTYYINDEVVGYAMPLNAADKWKSKNLSSIWYLFYDEFLCRDSTKYLGSKNNPYVETQLIESIFQTCDRGIDRPYRNEVTLIGCANTSTLYNPLFVSLGIDKYLANDVKARFVAPKNKLWVVENSLAKDVKALQDYKKSNVYLLSGDQTRDYAFETNGVDDKTFIEKNKGTLKPLFNVIYNDLKMGVYIDSFDMKMYICRKDIKKADTFALTTNDHKPSYKLMQMNYPQMTLIKQFYLGSNIRFSDGGVRFAIETYMKFDRS